MKKILVNNEKWQTRIAILRDDKLQNIYFWSHIKEQLERSFFKGFVTKVLPGIQTAFVDIGQDKSGFLHISEIDRDLAVSKLIDDSDEDENIQPTNPKSNSDISKILKEGTYILVQVSKEPIHEKGAKLTTCFTLPGRFIVLMPNVPRIGISKKIESKEERQRLKEILSSNLPQGMGAIIRTTSENQYAAEIVQDLEYLLDIWTKIQKDFNSATAITKLHQDIDLPLQVVRDNLDDDVEILAVDDYETHSKLYKFVKNIAPIYTDKVKLYQESSNLFEKFQIEEQIDQALQKKVNLKSGGSIIIESTEAMTVVDVNTGKYTGNANLEETVLKNNLEAAEEVVRQLRLRNIGGLIVIDFIDMTSHSNRQKLYRFFEKTLKERDKFQSVVLKVSEFGLVQMTRKRSGKTLIQELAKECSCCHGLGFIRSLNEKAYAILRKVKKDMEKLKPGTNVKISLADKVFDYLTTKEYNSILDIEKLTKCKMTLVKRNSLSDEDFIIEN